VQRVPVRIALDEPPPADRPLRVSLSVVATIDVGAPDAQPRRAAATAAAR
jgi:multidrug resistance efflux pump